MSIEKKLAELFGPRIEDLNEQDKQKIRPPIGDPNVGGKLIIIPPQDNHLIQRLYPLKTKTGKVETDLLILRD